MKDPRSRAMPCLKEVRLMASSGPQPQTTKTSVNTGSVLQLKRSSTFWKPRGGTSRVPINTLKIVIPATRRCLHVYSILLRPF